MFILYEVSAHIYTVGNCCGVLKPFSLATGRSELHSYSPCGMNSHESCRTAKLEMFVQILKEPVSAPEQ